MPFTAAASNILDSFRFQLGLSGDLAPRLAYAARYWAEYLYGKRFVVAGGDWAAAHVRALQRLSEAGLTRRRVTVRLDDGMRLELDQLTCFLLLKDIRRDHTYELPGEPSFSFHEGQTVFDIGGQQGIYSTYAASRVGARGRVVCAEPSPENHGLLVKNVALNGLTNATVVQAAVSDHAGTAELYESDYNTGAHSLNPLEGGAKPVKVRLLTLDQLCAETAREPDLLKIDVEGSVLAVLRGGRGVLARRKPAIVLEIDRPEDLPELRGLLEPLGYSLRPERNIVFAIPPR